MIMNFYNNTYRLEFAYEVEDKYGHQCGFE